MAESFVYTPHVQNSDILLNANESSRNLPENLLKSVQEMLPKILFNRYPDDTYTQLRHTYARHIGMDADEVICGNGSDQMLSLLISRFIQPGDVLYTFSPDFGMYDFYCHLSNGTMEKFEIQPGKAMDVDAFIAQGKAAGASLVMFSNPNNPTGQQLEREDLIRIVKAFAPVPVVIDEAYMEFGDASMLEAIHDYENLYVTRTLSKAYGLAGLRVGFLVSQKKNTADLQPLRVVYNLNTLSAAIAALVLEHASEFEAEIAGTIERRENLLKDLSACQRLQAHPSKGNFLCLQSPHKEELASMFADAGIAIRDYDGKDYVRITIGSEEECQAVKAVIAAFEGKESA